MAIVQKWTNCLNIAGSNPADGQRINARASKARLEGLASLKPDGQSRPLAPNLDGISRLDGKDIANIGCLTAKGF